MSKYPETSRDDILPGTWSNPKKERGESFDEPGNERNAPVPLRKGPPAANGWEKELYDVNIDVDV